MDESILTDMPLALLNELLAIIEGAIAVRRNNGNIGKFNHELQKAIDK